MGLYRFVSGVVWLVLACFGLLWLASACFGLLLLAWTCSCLLWLAFAAPNSEAKVCRCLEEKHSCFLQLDPCSTTHGPSNLGLSLFFWGGSYTVVTIHM